MRKPIAKLAAFLLSGLFMAVGVVASADDTDIYFLPKTATSAEPLVMLTLDYKSNLGSTICSNVNSGCTQAQYFIAKGVPQGTNQPVPNSGPFTFFNLLQSALYVVLKNVNGVKIGLMMSHNAENGCVGPTASGCSNGGYMLLGFTELHQKDSSGVELATSGFSQIVSKLSAIPLPQGNVAHAFQGAELFFEFFRYLTGQGVYNGHDGWSDFGTDACYNLNSAAASGVPGPDASKNEIDGYSTNQCNNYGTNGSKAPSLVYTGAPALQWDQTIETAPSSSSSTYKSPLTGVDPCTKIFTVNFMFQVSQQDNDSNTAINAAKASGGMQGANAGSSDAFPKVLNFLKTTDLADGTWGSAPNLSGSQSVTSYFVVDPTKINTTTTSYATNGGTNAPLSLSSDPATLIATLTDIFSQILSVSSTFTAVSIPTNAFNRASIANDVYLALFQADQNGNPAWQGDLKKLKLDSTQTFLVDANGTAAVASDGRIRYSALTYWTDGTKITTGDGSTTVIGDDGRAVNRGGAGQKIPGVLSSTAYGGTVTVGATNAASGARALYYDNSSVSGQTGSLVALNADSTTATALASWLPSFTVATNIPCISGSSTASTTTVATLNQLQFIRGFDALDNSLPNGETGSVLAGDATTSTSGANGCVNQTRGWVLGDPLHSRPLPINYGGSTTNPSIYVAMGTNDGFMHFFRNTTSGGAEDGTEVWAYMPKEMMSYPMGSSGGLQQTLMVNAPTSPASHPYGVDGQPSVFITDANGDGSIGTGDSAWLAFGLGRGGPAYYSLDVTTPTSAPTFLWKIVNTNTDFTELGLAMSRPQPGYVNVSGTKTPVWIFGGGYNANKDRNLPAATKIGTVDTSSGSPANLGCGCAVFIVNAQTGALIWKAVNGATTGSSSAKIYSHSLLKDSVPADVTAVDTDGDGYIDRILFGDTGGNVWRADLPGSTTTNWKLTKVATLGRYYVNDKANDRRFFNQVDLVRSVDSTGPFDAVLIGSGDREDPLDYGGLTTNFFYMIKDRNTGVGSPTGDSSLDPSGLGDVTSDCLQLGNCTTPPSLANGWRLQLNQGATGTSEKNLARSTTISGTVYFTTYLPPGSSGSGSSCGPQEGGGLLYAVSLQNAFSVKNYNVSDDSGNTNASTASDRIESLASGGIPAQVVYLPNGSIIKPDLSTEKVQAPGQIKSFWRRVEQ